MINLQEVEQSILTDKIKEARKILEQARWIICVDEQGQTHTIDLKKEKL